MVDFYSAIPIQLIYPVGGIILLVITWSFLRDATKADPETKKKLLKIYAGLLVGSIVLVAGIQYFKVSERLFPSFYEREELRQESNDADPWGQNFKLEDWQKPYR